MTSRCCERDYDGDGNCDRHDARFQQALADTISDTQIRALAVEAADARDLKQVEVCANALDGDIAARAECARVIAAAEAQRDE